MKIRQRVLLPITAGVGLLVVAGTSSRVLESRDAHDRLTRTGAPAVAAPFAAAPQVAEPQAAPTLTPEAEVARIRAHLLRIERELRAADISRLDAEQRAARASHLDRLHEYAARGVFPHNHDVPGRRVPVFVDEHGTHCAVGYLMAMSGEGALVSLIAAERNLARVPELIDVPGVAEWLDAAGLTLDEAAAIQPAYDPVCCMDPSEQRDRDAYHTASLVSVGLGGGAAAWSLLADREPGASRWPGAIGTGLGVAQMGLGVLGFRLDGDVVEAGPDIDDRFMYANLAMGALNTVLGIRALTGGDDEGDERSLGRGAEAERAMVRVSPWVTDGGGAGLRLDVRF
jgi:hypothetical protein